LGIVAHDLKNPLSTIQLAANFMHKNTGGLPHKDVHEMSGDILITSNRMFDLITNLLDVNKLEQNGITFLPTSIDIMALLRRSVMQYTPQADAKSLHFHLECAEESIIAYVDESATMQVIDNIISNAVKYSPQEKNITIRLQSRAGVVRVEVQDEGEGISPEDMQKLFGKFVRLSARPTGGEHSTGLGLSIVKKMVEAMSGRVWCESEVGKGATFIVELPTSSNVAENLS
jgi:signal transduction histidine kinase